MLRRPHHRRAGFSLTEVLVALFLVSAGLIALLTLFPLGAIQMGYAFRDDRSQQTALQADAKVRDLWRRRVLDNPTQPPTDPFYTTLEADPDGLGPLTAISTTVPQVSYPVLFDPIGWASYSGHPKQQSVAGVATNRIFRRTTGTLLAPLTPPLNTTQAMNYASLVDDLDFATTGVAANSDGQPPTAGNPNIVRQGRFNWAAVIQRPDNSSPRVAELKILVFDRRSPGVNPTAPNNEVALTSPDQLSAGNTVIRLNGTIDTLGVRVGSWVMDGTTSATIRNAHFYRLTAVSDDGTFTTVELNVPIARPRGEAPPNNPYTAQLYLFRELIDVYDRPPLAPNGYQPPTP